MIANENAAETANPDGATNNDLSENRIADFGSIGNDSATEDHAESISTALRTWAIERQFSGSSVPMPVDTTATDNAEHLAALCDGRLAYVIEWQKWIAFDGTRWNVAAGNIVALVATKLPGEIFSELAKRAKAPDDRTRYETRARNARTHGARTAMLSLAAAEMPISCAALNQNTEHLLCTPSGTVDLRSGELQANDPRRYITQVTSVGYEPEAQCPEWERFMLEICCGNAELVGYLQRAAGYSITGSVTEHALWFLLGSGRNGKGVFMRTVAKALGEYAATLPSDLVLTQREGQHPTVKASLFSKRLIVVNEPEKGMKWNEAQVKELTGGDTVSARRMREDFWDFTPTHKIWISSNYKPVVRGTDEGIWARLKLVPFDASFIGREDRKLEGRLAAELPGILRWLIDGAREWYRRSSVDAPKIITEAVAAYRGEQDIVGQFFEECLTFKPEGRTFRPALRNAYEHFCEENGAKPVGPRDLAERLRLKGVRDGDVRATNMKGEKVKGRGWHGVEIKPVAPWTEP